MMLNPEQEMSLGFQQYSAPTEEEKKSRTAQNRIGKANQPLCFQQPSVRV